MFFWDYTRFTSFHAMIVDITDGYIDQHLRSDSPPSHVIQSLPVLNVGAVFF